jgi:hypothetical protein
MLINHKTLLIYAYFTSFAILRCTLVYCYGLDDRGVTDRVPFGSRILHFVQTSSYPMGTGGYFLGGMGLVV